MAAAADAKKERTYVMIKPDGVQRGLVGEIIGRFERVSYCSTCCSCYSGLRPAATKDLDTSNSCSMFYYVVCAITLYFWADLPPVLSAELQMNGRAPLQYQQAFVLCCAEGTQAGRREDDHCH